MTENVPKEENKTPIEEEATKSPPERLNSPKLTEHKSSPSAPLSPLSSALPTIFSFEIKSEEGTKYQIILTTENNELEIKAASMESTEVQTYTVKLSRDKLIEINDRLSMFRNVEEIKDYLMSLEKKMEMKIREEGPIIIFEFLLKFGISKEWIVINFNGDNLDQGEIIKFLCKEISSLKREIRKIKGMTNIKEYLGLSFAFESTLFENKENYDFLVKHLERKMGGKIIGFKKLFKATINGGTGSIFHLRCDGHRNTVVIIKMKDGKVFGGFASIPWSSPLKGEYAYDSNAFLFSFDNKEIYKCKNPQHALWMNSPIGPNFGDDDLYLSEDCFSISNQIYFSQSAYDYLGKTNALSGTNGWSTNLMDYEVFEIVLL